MITLNKLIACKPFKEVAIKTKIEKGFGGIEQKQSLISTEVLLSFFGDHNLVFTPGDTVWLYGDALSHHVWSRKVYNVDNLEFILIPFESIVMCKHLPVTSDLAPPVGSPWRVTNPLPPYTVGDPAPYIITCGTSTTEPTDK
jgi:hypothetical protein